MPPFRKFLVMTRIKPKKEGVLYIFFICLLVWTFGSLINCTSRNNDSPVTLSIHQSEDSLITTEVTSAFVSDPYLQGHTIQVETHEGRVLLEGIVQNQLQSQRAERIARKVTGVTSVSNSLEVLKGR